MGVGTQLMGLGLGMGEVQAVARTLLAYAREKVGRRCGRRNGRRHSRAVAVRLTDRRVDS